MQSAPAAMYSAWIATTASGWLSLARGGVGQLDLAVEKLGTKTAVVQEGARVVETLEERGHGLVSVLGSRVLSHFFVLVFLDLRCDTFWSNRSGAGSLAIGRTRRGGVGFWLA